MAQVDILKRSRKLGWHNTEQMLTMLNAAYPVEFEQGFFHRAQTSPTSATAVEVEQAGGLTIADKTKTELAIFLACDTNDNAYDTKSVTGHYITSDGTKKDFTLAYNTTDTTTEVTGPTDFYCWNLEDYTAATVLVSSVAVQAGDNVYIGTTGMVADAELRLATIAAAATYPVVTTLFGAGDVYGLEETNTAGDVGKVVTLQYWTPWGKLKTASFTLAANTTTIVRLTDTTTSLVTVDFYRRYEMSTTGTVGKYVAIGFDADKRAGTAAIDVFYGVIEEGNYYSVHSRMMVAAEAYYRTYLGDIVLTEDNPEKILIAYVTYTPYGDTVAITRKFIIRGGVVGVIDIHEQLEPLSEVTVKIADDAATPVNATIDIRWAEVAV